MDSNQISSSKDKQDNNNRLLAEGKRLYLKDLGKQIQQLEQSLNHSLTDTDTQKAVFRLLLSMKGSAPVFGFARIGEMAEAMIAGWEAVASSGSPAGAAALQEAADISRVRLMEMRLEYETVAREMMLADRDSASKGILVHSDCRLLVIDDDELLRTYTVRRLELDGYQVDQASTVEAAKKKLRETTYDLVTLDLIMYPESGYELFDFLKSDPSLKWVPLIVLSGRNDLDDKVRCFHLGADDYVTKPFQYEELAARISSLLVRTKSFTEMAFRDLLTGLNNRRYFDLQLQMELERVQRYPVPLSICFIDIDGFKGVNDTYGHHIGDLVLQGLAYMLQKNLRATDFIARYGGEEFVVVLPNTPESSAMKIMQLILQQMQDKPIVQYEGISYSITFSAGIAEYHSDLAKEQWIKLADEAMYRAKQQGRNRVLAAGAGFEYIHGISGEAAKLRKRVLLADDDANLRSMLANKLKQLSIEVMEAHDGLEAYHLLQSQTADLCILNGTMPHLSGIELLQKIKSEEELNRPEMKVIMLSARQREAEIAKCLEFGADDYMIKPFPVLELEIRIKQLLGIE